MVIVVLTIFEVSLVLFTLFEILLGAKLHQLNAAHLRYTVAFSEQVRDIQANNTIDLGALRRTIYNIRYQPTECLRQVGDIEIFIMRRIETYNAIELCKKDIVDANNGLTIIDLYDDNKIDRESFLEQLSILSNTFKQNSIDFELPTSKTVEFIFKLMVPIVIVVSIFIIIFIIYLSRNITTSINNVISLLSEAKSDKALDETISDNVTGELRELLIVAKARVKEELVKTEINQQLETLVERRTASLTKANQELSEFAYRLSHDLKSPLSSSKGLARFIVQDIDDNHLPEARENSQKIVLQMEKLERLIRSVLTLTRDKPQTEEVAEVNFDELFDLVRKENNELLIESNCQFSHEVDIQHPLKTGVRSLALIFGHLISNAAKYSNPDKMCRSVKIEVKEWDSGYHIDVIDNGIGIPENRLPEVFLMFKRFHPNISFGSGLGLATVKKYVGYLNGSIEFNTSDEGTTFTIILPKEDVV